jgi:MoaA/NifB/PqqE/SkfB family radical SAM enzyme
MLKNTTKIMLPPELYQQLEKTYKILCFVDLADISGSPGAIFELFKTHYKSAYKENERLVFYTSENPGNKLLEHIQQAAKVIDISNWFILICCPEDLKDQIPSNDPMQQLVVDCDSNPLSDGFIVPDTMCVFPFKHLEINHQGAARPCCVYKNQIGQVPTQSIKEIFYSDKMENLRNDFLNGIKPNDCSHCWNLEDNNLRSFRQANLDLDKYQLYTKWISTPAVYSLDLKPGNVCNFKCRICNSRSSSLYAGEQLAKSTNPESKIRIQQLIDGSRWFENNETFVQEFEELVGQIENLDFYGGEPFLLKNLKSMLSKAINVGRAQHIRLHFNTNGSIFPAHLLDIFKKFKHVDMAISLDCVGKRFEYERGGVWTEIEENLKKLRQLADDQFNVYLFPTVNIQNVLYLDELYSWAKSNDLKIFLNFLEVPQFMSIDYMTQEAKDLVVAKFQNSSIIELQNVAKRVIKSPGSNGEKFIEYMQQLDNWRNEDFSSAHTEIANAMGYVLN